MRTSARGKAEAGFTLIELLIVVVIIGIAGAMIGLSAMAAPDRALENDAQRLRDAFRVAQSEARSDGRGIVWHADDQGWWFTRAGQPVDVREASAENAVPWPDDRFERDPILRARKWSEPPVQVRRDPPSPLRFDTEWVRAPYTVELVSPGRTIVIAHTASGDDAPR